MSKAQLRLNLHGQIMSLLDQLREEELSQLNHRRLELLERAASHLIAHDAMASARMAVREEAPGVLSGEQETTQLVKKGLPVLCEVLRRASSTSEREERLRLALLGVVSPILQERDKLRARVAELRKDVRRAHPTHPRGSCDASKKKVTPAMAEKKIDVTPEQVIEAVAKIQENLRKKYDASPIRACDVRSYIFKGNVGAPPTELHRLQERAVNRALQKARRAGAIEWSTIVHTWRTVE